MVICVYFMQKQKTTTLGHAQTSAQGTAQTTTQDMFCSSSNSVDSRIPSTFHIRGMNVISWMKIFWFFVKDSSNKLCNDLFCECLNYKHYICNAFFCEYLNYKHYLCNAFFCDALKAWIISTTYLFIVQKSQVLHLKITYYTNVVSFF
jgi:hypothetical protein